MSKYVYFGSKWAIIEHDKIITLSGGRNGILHPEMLESTLKFMQHDGYYPRFEDKLSHLVFSIAKHHCFVDGNKRSSIALGAYFLEINGKGDMVSKFIVEMENIVLWTACNLITKKMLKIIIDELINQDELSESTKINLVSALNKYTDLAREQ